MERRKRRVVRRPAKCPLCEGKIEPSYQEPEVINAYLTGRGKIASREKTGICAHHQRYLTREIKRARHLALLPFVRGIH